MPTAGLEPAIPATEQPQNSVLDDAAAEIGLQSFHIYTTFEIFCEIYAPLF
jgi:hypothetical protein